MTNDASPEAPVIIGRSSSHFTRVTRVFALELEVAHSFQVLRDLASQDVLDYGGNPALKIPNLKTESGVWFGAANVCRELWRRSRSKPRVIWPEDLGDPLLANAQELVIHAMATEVSLVLSEAAGTPDNAHQNKMRSSLRNSVAWLEEHAPRALRALPAERSVSYLEITLACLVPHLEFRGVLAMDGYPALRRLAHELSARPSLQATPYRFDP